MCSRTLIQLLFFHIIFFLYWITSISKQTCCYFSHYLKSKKPKKNLIHFSPPVSPFFRFPFTGLFLKRLDYTWYAKSFPPMSSPKPTATRLLSVAFLLKQLLFSSDFHVIKCHMPLILFILLGQSAAFHRAVCSLILERLSSLLSSIPHTPAYLLPLSWPLVILLSFSHRLLMLENPRAQSLLFVFCSWFFLSVLTSLVILFSLMALNTI